MAVLDNESDERAAAGEALLPHASDRKAKVQPARRIGLWLSTEHWLLMTATPAYAPLFAKLHQRNGQHFKTAMNLEPQMTEASFWEPVLANLQRSYENGTGVHLVGFPKSGAGTEIGCVIDFSGIVHYEFQACWLGFRLDHSLEGRGMMRSALAPAIAAVFERYQLHRIMASHLPENQRSGRLLRTLGFGVEGYSRDFMHMNGAWRDNVLTALLAPSCRGSLA